MQDLLVLKLWYCVSSIYIYMLWSSICCYLVYNTSYVCSIYTTYVYRLPQRLLLPLGSLAMWSRERITERYVFYLRFVCIYIAIMLISLLLRFSFIIWQVFYVIQINCFGRYQHLFLADLRNSITLTLEQQGNRPTSSHSLCLPWSIGFDSRCRRQTSRDVVICAHVWRLPTSPLPERLHL